MLRLLPVLGLLLSGIPLSASAACLDPEDPPPSVDAPTLSVTISTPQASYRPGETAVVLASVRTVVGSKVQGAAVAIDVSRNGHVVKKLYGHTDASGESRIKLKVPTSAGRLDAFATARLEVVPSYDCRAALLYQYGEKTATPFLTIR